MSATQEKTIVIDLDGKTARISGKDDLYQGDSNANEINIEFVRAGEKASLSGYTASGEFERSDETKVPCEGSVNGNVAKITLNEHCYVRRGPYRLTVRLIKSAEKINRTILEIIGEVQPRGSGPTVDINETLVNVDKVIELYNEMNTAKNEAVNAKDAANAAAGNANNAAARANQAAAAIENMTASATGLATGEEATVTVTEGPDGKHLSFGIPRGEKGEKGDPGTIENVTITSIEGLTEALESVNAVKLGGKYPEYYITLENLFDNSDFTDPVYQAGLGGLHGAITYALDRWIFSNTADKLSLNNGAGLSFGVGNVIYQRPVRCNVTDGNDYTLAIWTSDGSAYCTKLTAEYTNVGNSGYIAIQNENCVYINNFGDGLPIKHVGLFRGLYTADQLQYVQKDYTAELAECQSCYRPLGDNTCAVIGMSSSVGEGGLLRTSAPMRQVDSSKVTIINRATVYVRASGNDYAITSMYVSKNDYSGVEVVFNAPGLPAKVPCTVHTSGEFAFSADP